MKNTTSLMALFGAILLLLACTAQSRQEPLGRRLSQAGAVASGSGDSVSTSTRTESSDRDAAVVEGTTEMPSTVVDGKQSCHCHWDCYNLAQLAYYLALQLALGMPRPPTKIPIRRRKEVKIIIVPPKPVPEIPLKRLLGSLLTVLYRVKSEVVKNIDLLSYETKITSNQFCFPLHQKKDKI
ncbi:hypothetical protein Ndes2437B_g00123 [Nannochloris sp. 'desiccata']